MPARKGNAGDPTTRNALLDAAQHVMRTEGYAGATTRRVASEAGVNSALVSYYFGSLDGMFIALFRRGAERSFERLGQALGSAAAAVGLLGPDPRPVELIVDDGVHRTGQPPRGDPGRDRGLLARFRRAQLDSLTQVLQRYGVDPDEWPASVVILGLSSLSRFMLIEEAFGVDIGHEETEAKVEEFIRRLEGERCPSPT